MPYSMTGFGYAQKSSDDTDVIVKIRSVNNKGIDISVKAPRDILFFIEQDIKNLIKENFARGSFQVFIDIVKKQPEILVDKHALKSAVKEVKHLSKFLGLNLSDDKIYDIAHHITEDTRQENTIDESLKKLILETVEEAIKELKEERKKEGEKLVKDIKERLDKIENYLKQIEEKKDQIIERAKERAIQKLKELLGEEYSERAFIEATILADKMDITEEIVRLKSHIKRFRELLNKDEPVGRKMDFLCQEMHREINTLGNKMPDLSEYTVEMKSEVEKIRQQVQNIE